MATTTITQFPQLPLSATSTAAYDFVIPVDATVDGSLRTYKLSLDQLRNFALNSTRAHTISGSTDLLMGSGSNVAIGNSSPSAKLDVTGTIKASGTITSTGGFIGNVSTATKLYTARQFKTLGDITTPVYTFDGTGNVHMTTSIAAAAVTTPKIKDGAVTHTKIAADMVRTDHISDRNITRYKLSTTVGHRVSHQEIEDATIITSKIKDLNVTSGKLAAASVTNTKIATDQIDNGHLKDGIITSAKIVNSAVGNDKIADGAVTNTKLGPKSITFDKIVDKTITNGQIADGTVTTALIGNSVVTHAKLQTVSNVAGTWSANPKITINDRGIVTAIENRTEALMLSGGTMTGRINIAGGDENSAGLFWENIQPGVDDQASITWTKSGSDRHTLRFAVTGAEPADQNTLAAYETSTDDRILFEVPNLSGVSIKVDGTEYPIWHKGHVPDVVAEVQALMDEFFFTGFKPDGGTLRTAEGAQTLILTNSDVNTALGFTAAPNTRAHITDTLGFEPLSRTRSSESLAGAFVVQGNVDFKKGLHVKDDVIIGANSNDAYFNVRTDNSTYLRLNSGNRRLTIGNGGANIVGDGALGLYSTNQHIHIQSANAAIYNDAKGGHFFRKANGGAGSKIYDHAGRGAMKVGDTGSSFVGRLHVATQEHNGIVVSRSGSNAMAQIGVYDEYVTFGGAHHDRSIIRIRPNSARASGHPNLDFVSKDVTDLWASSGHRFRNSSHGSYYAYLRTNVNEQEVFNLQVNSPARGLKTILGHGNGNTWVGISNNSKLLFLQNHTTGLVGIGTTNPTGHAYLTVNEKPGAHASILARNAQNTGGIWLGHNWTHRSGQYSAIHNDTHGYKTMMLVGNTSAGGARKVSVWDVLTVGGNAQLDSSQTLSVHGNTRISHDLTVGGTIRGNIENKDPADWTCKTYFASSGHQNATTGWGSRKNYGVYVNGKWVSNLKNRGINVAIIKADGTLRYSNSFDIYGAASKWNNYIDWVRDKAAHGDIVVSNTQDGLQRLTMPIRNARNSRDTNGWAGPGRHHGGYPTERATYVLQRLGARKIFELQNQTNRRGAAWAFIFNYNQWEAYFAGVLDGKEKNKITNNRYYDGFNFCFIEKVSQFNAGSNAITFNYSQLLAMGGQDSETFSGATRAHSTPQRMSASFNNIKAESIVKTDPDMNDYCYPPSGDALVFDNPFVGYGSDGHNGTDRGWSYYGQSEPYYWRDHSSSWDDWSYSRGRRRNHTWYERNMLRYGWGHQGNHYGGLRIKVPDGVDTLWVQKHSGWNHDQVYYLKPGGTANTGAGHAPSDSGMHTRYGYRKRSGKFGSANYSHGNNYTPYDGFARGVRYWIGAQWHPIPLERKLLDEFPYISLVAVNSSDAWLTGLAFGRNPWNHAKTEAINLHWRLNGGNYMWWSGGWWYNHWTYAHAWHNRRVYVPCIFNGKDKILYNKGHSWGVKGEAGDGWAIRVNGVDLGSLHSTFRNPFSQKDLPNNYVGSNYQGIHVPADVIMKNHHNGSGSVSEHQWQGDVGYLAVDLHGGWSDRHMYSTEMGTHDYYPDPYIVHNGLSDHDHFNGPLAASHRPYGGGHPYGPGSTNWNGH